MPQSIHAIHAKRKLRTRRVAVLATLLCGTISPYILPVAYAYGADASTRSVDGRVVDGNDAPIAGAIVYLNDLRTKAVESYITQEDGAYRFEQISPSDDYTLWAQQNGRKSHTKTLSSFDDRSDFHVILKLAAGK